MTLNRQSALKYLQTFDFESLFIEELGWDTVDRVKLPLEVDGGEVFEVVAIAQKRGFIVYQCLTEVIPARSVRVKLDRLLTEFSKSHLLVFGDGAKQAQTWMWVRQEPGKPLAPRFEEYRVGQSADRLFLKLEALAVAFAEEERLTLVDVAQRVKKAFDVEKVTKAFFTRFEKEHKQFLTFIDGIQSEFDRSWYASLMLNRLMFVYFIQKKRFLDDDPNYLKNRLERCRSELGEGEFYSFYRQFLLKLFHEGLGKPGRDKPLDQLLGEVPYLNGGLFEVHQLEETYDAIQVPDEAFEKVFAFFDDFDWHLDDRPLRKQNEINPDVLGYIFEKYINNKQMGAYYTKEDITEYISKNTIIPFLFDAAEKGCKVAFKAEGTVWALLRESPDRYLYDAVKKGIDVELPAEIAIGIENVSQRGGWNKTIGDESIALPTETWREHVARRSRALDLRVKLAAGEVASINDLITYNLDIRQFAQDVITSCESSDLLKAFYQAIEQVSVLDPTCGSGAFLFAALNILEPMYTACLERMQGFVDEDDLRLSREENAKPRYEKFRSVLMEMEKHPNPKYFVLKSIMLNNLYGVDIMEEATEICKLRLFLKLVAQVERQPKQPNFGLEPLPDIDFNIRAGNTLVGFASLDEVRKAIKEDGDQLKFDFQDDASRIDEKAELADQAFQRFRQMQTEFGMNAEDFRDSKKELRRRFKELNDELNRYLAEEYGVDIKKTIALENWRESHQPFNWFVEFYGIIKKGGFSILIGNPPYVELSKINYRKSLKSFYTEPTGNLYCPVVERSCVMTHKIGRLGMILPMSLSCTERMNEMRDVLESRQSVMWTSHFSGDAHPSVLFEGVKLRLDILIVASSNQSRIFSSPYCKWFADARQDLFKSLTYADIDSRTRHLQLIPKTGNRAASNAVEKILKKKSISNFFGSNSKTLYIHRVTTMFIKCFDFIPYFCNETDGIKKSEDYKPFSFKNNDQADIALSVFNSSTFFFYFITFGDCFHCGKEFIKSFPCELDEIKGESRERLVLLGKDLMEDLQRKSNRRVQSKASGKVEYDEFWSRLSKPIIDEIDRVLAQHYGFTDEELDFIINYDIKYRMGRDKGGDE
jgi:hypothetical protein